VDGEEERRGERENVPDGLLISIWALNNVEETSS
jgi:hypothetical protein